MRLNLINIEKMKKPLETLPNFLIVIYLGITAIVTILIAKTFFPFLAMIFLLAFIRKEASKREISS